MLKFLHVVLSIHLRTSMASNKWIEIQMTFVWWSLMMLYIQHVVLVMLVILSRLNSQTNHILPECHRNTHWSSWCSMMTCYLTLSLIEQVIKIEYFNRAFCTLSVNGRWEDYHKTLYDTKRILIPLWKVGRLP